MAILVALAVHMFLTSGSLAQAELEIVDTISGHNLKLIQTAMTYFTGAGLTLDGYRITVIKRDGHSSVLFEDAHKKPGQYGSSTPSKPDFEVRFSDDGSRVVRANFSR